MRPERRDHELVEGAELSFARHRQGRDDEADQKGDDGDEAWHGEPDENEIGIEPVARHHGDVARHLPARAQIGRQGCDDLGQITRDDLRGIGTPSIEDDLHIAAPLRVDIAREGRPDLDRRNDLLAVDEIMQRLFIIGAGEPAESRRAVNALDELISPFAAVAVEDGDVGILHFERCREGKDEELQDRRHDDHHSSSGVAQYRQKFLDDQGPDAFPHVRRASFGCCAPRGRGRPRRRGEVWRCSSGGAARCRRRGTPSAGWGSDSAPEQWR